MNKRSFLEWPGLTYPRGWNWNIFMTTVSMQGVGGLRHYHAKEKLPCLLIICGDGIRLIRYPVTQIRAVIKIELLISLTYHIA